MNFRKNVRKCRAVFSPTFVLVVVISNNGSYTKFCLVGRELKLEGETALLPFSSPFFPVHY